MKYKSKTVKKHNHYHVLNHNLYKILTANVKNNFLDIFISIKKKKNPRLYQNYSRIFSHY